MPRAHERAVAYVEGHADVASGAACSRIARVLAAHGQPPQAAQSLTRTLEVQARVTLNFHPDRLGPDGCSVAERLLRDGRYRSQFDTKITNGSPTAFPGGQRDRWEERLFGGAYHTDVAALSEERPKYGAFNVMSHPDGASPRFGSCYFELSPATLARCTFTWGDSHAGPEQVGTLARFEVVLVAWLEAVDSTGAALGVSALDVPSLLARLSCSDDVRESRSVPPHGRALDDYIEAQVHGPLDLGQDIEALVIDPAFDGTEVGAQLAALASKYGFPLRRHRGFVLRPGEIPGDFRGPRMRPLAERIACGEELDAVALGLAAQSLIREPAKWLDWGAAPETWQHIKQLWHVLVRFGRDRAGHG